MKPTEIQDFPVAKIFIYKGEYYLYDTYTNHILKVSKEHYAELKELQTVGCSEYLTNGKNGRFKDDIKLLMDKGMLRYNFIDKIEHPLIPYVSLLADKCLTEIIFQVTQNCNFNCRYCTFAVDNGFEHVHNENNMTWETAQKALDYFYMHSCNSYDVAIYFYGGEPLLNFGLIEKIVDYAETLFETKAVSFNMTTNASVMNESMIHFFIKHKFRIAISFDGNKEIQDKHRKFGITGKGTYDTVFENIKRIKEINKNYFEEAISFMPVVFDDENYSEVQDFFASVGIKKVNPLNVNLRGIDYREKMTFDKGKMVTDEKNNLAGINEPTERYGECYSDKKQICGSWHHSGPCVAGVNRLFADCRGVFFPCEKACEFKELSIGNISTGINEEKIEEFLNIGKLTENECKSCWAMRFCNLCVDQCCDFESEALSHYAKNIFCNAQKKRILDFLKNSVD